MSEAFLRPRVPAEHRVYADVLQLPTPVAWVDAAVRHWRALLIDHANCEKKAASTALSLVFAYPEDVALTSAMSRLAREELRHFEQVQNLMRTLEVSFVRQKPGRYGASLRAWTRTVEPARKLDLLLTGAIIEARSCERFALLAPALEHCQPAVAQLYAQLARSEARHFQLYLELAWERDQNGEYRQRLDVLACSESELASAPDTQFRFHSGAPA